MSFKELFKRYKIYTIVGLIVLIMLVAGGTTLGVLLGKQNSQQLNIPANAVTITGFHLTYRTSGTNATVTRCKISASGSLSIPRTVSKDGITYTVTMIQGMAFRGCNRLTSITIPDSVTSIGSDAFGDCSSLTSITIPDSVTSIGDDVFSGCDSLTSITIPDSLTIIGDGAFSGSGLTSIDVDSGNTAYSSIDGVLFIVINVVRNLPLTATRKPNPIYR